MNSIEAKNMQTCYGYYERYWVIDGKPMITYLEDYKPKSLSNFGFLLGLLPAWSGKLIWKWENDFIWEMVNSQEELNVPILVCEDDCDLSCIVILVHIRKTKTMVYWDKIGILDNSKINSNQYGQSGILCLEAYTNEDWEKYGDNIATQIYGSSEYWEWVNENCYEEHIRQLRNYLKPYMQKEQNIEWIWKPNWEFKREDYKKMVKKYQEDYNSCKISL